MLPTNANLNIVWHHMQDVTYRDKTPEHCANYGSFAYGHGRFPDILALKEKDFPDYLANEFYGIIICEGPDQKNPLHTQYFFEQVLHDPQRERVTIIACGMPNDGSGYANYFLLQQEAHFGSVIVGSRPVVDSTIPLFCRPSIKAYNLTASVEEAWGMSIKVFHIPRIPDFKHVMFNAADMRLLYDIAKKIPGDNVRVVCHCADGVGPSALIVFAMVLFRNYEQIFVEDPEQTAANIADLLHEFRELRPQVIQTPEQLRQAIWLGMQFERCKNSLPLEEYQEYTTSYQCCTLL